MRRLLILIVAVLPLYCSAQIDIRTFDYGVADSIALNLPKIKYESFASIADVLTAKVNTDHEKFRAIFRWIADTIRYSYANKTIKPDLVIKKGSAVCSGYSYLLKAMCDRAGIECVVVNGYSKTLAKDIGKKLTETDHAWNAVKLNGKWYVTDITWASGYFDMDTKKHMKEFREEYYLPDPDFFYKKHYPENKDQLFYDTKLSKKAFIQYPIYYKAYEDLGIKELKPSRGNIKLKLKDSLEIIVDTDQLIYTASFQLGKKKQFVKPVMNVENHQCVFRYKFDKPTKDILTVYIQGAAIAAYSIIVE